jgi:hypothetical protein
VKAQQFAARPIVISARPQPQDLGVDVIAPTNGNSPIPHEIENKIETFPSRFDSKGRQLGVGKAMIDLLVNHPGQWMDITEVASRLGISTKQSGQIGRCVQNASVPIASRRNHRWMEYCYLPEGYGSAGILRTPEPVESSSLPTTVLPAPEPPVVAQAPLVDPHPPVVVPVVPVAPFPRVSPKLYEEMPGAKFDALDIICDEHGNLYVAVPFKPQWPITLRG